MRQKATFVHEHIKLHLTGEGMWSWREDVGFEWSGFVFLRALGLIYAVAFLMLINDVIPLIGKEGLLPAELFLERIHSHLGDWEHAFWEIPSLFHFACSDDLLLLWSWVGFVLSLCVVFGLANIPILLSLWFLYFSFVSVGQRWFSFGWESQLLETGLLAVFLVPFFDPRPFKSRSPKIIHILGGWLIARIMFGAGLIKIRGDECWRDLTCLNYHFETQPVPNPLSFYIHHLPNWILESGVLFNHFVELVVPFFLLGPSKIRNSAALVMVVFQAVLILSGNLSFLNWLTILPCLLCIDDVFWNRIVPNRLVLKIKQPSAQSSILDLHRYVYAALVVYLSIPVVQNLLSTEQSMNRSFSSWRIVNTYGAFGSVGSERAEIVIEGREKGSEDWLEYDFKCKPGALEKRPCWISPYHYRLDWLAWFAGLEIGYGRGVYRETWLVHLIWKLLHADSVALSLLDGDPFEGKVPYEIRVMAYHYTFAEIGDENWWKREVLGIYVQPQTKESEQLQKYLIRHGWLKP